MNANDYHQYLVDLKDWSNQVDTILKENNIDEEAYSQWKQQMENLMKQIEEKIEKQELNEEDLIEAEEEARGLYESSLLIREEIEHRVNAVKIGEHKLPPLPYDYAALEPHISAEIMRLHHDKHHKSYVDGLNKAEKMMQEARKTGDYSLLKHWEREAAFHGSGHYLHTIFWSNMKPKGGGVPKGPLLNQIEKDFGSFEMFKNHFTEAADKVEGVGWAILVWAPRSHRLEILQTEKHQLFTQWDTIPLLVLDVWEHAYYLQYKNEKKQYIDNWWNVVNWNDVSNRFVEAKKVKWKPF